MRILFCAFIISSFFLIITSFKFSNKNLDTPKQVEAAFEKALEFAKKEKDKPHFTYYFEKEKDKYNSGEVLESLPKEYQNINELAWFLKD